MCARAKRETHDGDAGFMMAMLRRAMVRQPLPLFGAIMMLSHNEIDHLRKSLDSPSLPPPILQEKAPPHALIFLPGSGSLDAAVEFMTFSQTILSDLGFRDRNPKENATILQDPKILESKASS